MGMSLGVDGDGLTTNENREGETARSPEKEQTIIKMGRPRKAEEGEKWREKAVDRKHSKMTTKAVQQYKPALPRYKGSYEEEQRSSKSSEWQCIV